ncbi:MAG: AraC family transcriptional regulator [Lentisphaerae bacterium]|nr:AraC family transcriptional regulator [Lentisphaerota bacterium]
MMNMPVKSTDAFEFIGFNRVPECDALVDKYFSYYVIQYAERGELNLFIDSNPVKHLKGPVVWLTFPGPYTFRAIHMLEELLIQLGEQPRSLMEETFPVKNIRKIAAKIETDPLLEWDWRKTAKESGISYPHFRRIFHDTFKTPPARFLLLKRLEKSAAMLRSGGGKIEGIAELCGFYDLYHFSKLFRKYYGTAPGQYRRNHLTG